ncbi:MAG TPA: hypothetical protein VHU22_19320 [Xanthobacteraceae bacterium]|nr:hypothetical protein [Xanthobacteraceae bacterium]
MDRSLDDWELIDPLGHDCRGSCDHDRHIEVLLEQVTGFDGTLVTAVNQNHAFAVKCNKGSRRCRFAGHCEERSHLWAGVFGLRRPAGGLTYVHERDICTPAAFLRSCAEQWSFLCAADGERRSGLDGSAKPFEFGTAQLVGAFNIHARAGTPDRIYVKRHRALARAKKYGSRAVGHLFKTLALLLEPSGLA